MRALGLTKFWSSHDKQKAFTSLATRKIVDPTLAEQHGKDVGHAKPFFRYDDCSKAGWAKVYSNYRILVRKPQRRCFCHHGCVGIKRVVAAHHLAGLRCIQSQLAGHLIDAVRIA